MVNDDGGAGATVDPLILSGGGAGEESRVESAVGNHAFLPGPWRGPWVERPQALIFTEDVAACRIQLACHTRQVLDLAHFVLVKLRLSNGAGEGLPTEKLVVKSGRAGRPISV